MKRAGKLQGCLLMYMAMLVLATACNSAASTSSSGPVDNPTTGLPENVGYLRAAHPAGGRLTIFDADTFQVYRSVDLPPSTSDFSHRLEIGPFGRIWLGYSQIGLDDITKFGPGARDRVLVFSHNGDLEHELDIGCSPPDTGIAFAIGYAFIACAAGGASGVVAVVDTATMEIVKTFHNVGPTDEDPTRSIFYITAVEEVAGLILVIGFGSPPKDYERLTRHASAVTKVGVIDPETLTVRGYLTGLEPGFRARSALEVDGKAWLFNHLSHLEERLPRTDVYVMDPHSMEIVGGFNLERPFPMWAEYGDDGAVHIYHRPTTPEMWTDGHVSGLTRLDLETRAELFTPTPNVRNAFALGVYRNRPCLTHRGSTENGGLWCMKDDGTMEQSLPQKSAFGVQFKKENYQTEHTSR